MVMSAEKSGVRRTPDDLEVVGFREYLPNTDDVVHARHFVREVLRAGGAGADDVAAAELVVGELALNVVRHAGTSFSVLVQLAPGLIKVAVRDDSDTVPRTRPHLVGAVTGRGLSMVASTTDEWGVEPLGRGKEVWAVVRQR